MLKGSRTTAEHRAKISKGLLEAWARRKNGNGGHLPPSIRAEIRANVYRMVRDEAKAALEAILNEK